MKTSKGNLELKYSFNVLAVHEEKYDITVFDELAHMSIAAVRRLVCSGLYHLKPTMTESQAGEIIEDVICSGMTIDDIKVEIAETIESTPFIQRLLKNNRKVE